MTPKGTLVPVVPAGEPTPLKGPDPELVLGNAWLDI